MNTTENIISHFINCVVEYEIQFGKDIHSARCHELAGMCRPGCGLGNCAIEQIYIDSALHILEATHNTGITFHCLIDRCTLCTNAKPFAVQCKS